MYKLIAVDLDGTMLNQYGMVTENTKNVIQKTIEKGTDVIIASGRPIDCIKTIAKEIGSENYFIAGNGALIYDIQKDEIVYDKLLPKEKVLEIIKICEDNSISYNVYTDKTILAKALKYNVLYYQKENLKKDEKKQTKISIVENIYEYVKNKNDDKYFKMTICDENKTVFQSIIRKLRQLDEIEVLDVSHMSRKTIKQGTEEKVIEYYYTEIGAKNVDKWEAIDYLIKKLNISKEEVIAIGDNVNDKKMIQEAGLGVAMERKHATNYRNSRLYNNFKSRRRCSKSARKILLEILIFCNAIGRQCWGLKHCNKSKFSTNITKILQQY